MLQLQMHGEIWLRFSKRSTYRENRVFLIILLVNNIGMYFPVKIFCCYYDWWRFYLSLYLFLNLRCSHEDVCSVPYGMLEFWCCERCLFVSFQSLSVFILPTPTGVLWWKKFTYLSCVSLAFLPGTYVRYNGVMTRIVCYNHAATPSF